MDSKLTLFVQNFLKVYGLDINPRAVKIAWINLYLNALDDDGLPIYDGEGKTLLDRVEFYESDLLSYCKDNKIELDRIVGCIPQVDSVVPMLLDEMKEEKSFTFQIQFIIISDSQPKSRGNVKDCNGKFKRRVLVLLE